MSISDQIVHLSRWEFWLFLTLATGAAATSFFYAFRLLSRARTIEDTPTARVRSAQQGYVELVGEAYPKGGNAIGAPLTGTDCCWFRYKIEKKGQKNWRTIEHESSAHPFLLRDASGDCLIDPSGAVVTPRDRSVWYGNSRTPHGRRPVSTTVEHTPLIQWGKWLTMDVGFGGRYRYTEERIYPGDPLYAIGWFKSLDEIDHRRSRSELTRGLLRRWKQDQKALLAEYDRNRDGKIDPDEWEQARQAAAQQARQEHSRQLRDQIIHTMSAPGSRRQPYLLSTLPQYNLVKRARLWAAGCLLLFFLAGGVAVVMLGSRLSV
jgi:hypothetical protein